MGPGRGRDGRGFTLIELVVTMSLIGILAAAAVPLFQVSVKRSREIELRSALRQIRRAIDQFHLSYVTSGGAIPGGGGGGQPTPPPPPLPGATPAPAVERMDVSEIDPVDSMGYPESLRMLVEGVHRMGGAPEDKILFLRRVPLDPLSRVDSSDLTDDNFGWEARCYPDPPDTKIWCRKNVWDVRTKATGKALDGSDYSTW